MASTKRLGTELGQPTAGRHRIGTLCPRGTGLTKFRCPCDDCKEFRQLRAAWNTRLKGEGLGVIQGPEITPKRRRRK